LKPGETPMLGHYQLACGQLPFQGESMARLSSRITHELQPEIRIHNTGLPNCVATIIDKAMARDIEQRYDDDARMAEALRACRENLSLSERQDPLRSAAATA
jgi:eukaryotic-like serine/threonine-protein kinase